MIIPVRTDYRMRQTPWVNYAIIAANILLFVLGFNADTQRNQMKIFHWMLHPDMPQIWQFFSSVFLHANWGHLLGNMVFLWVFGNAINDKLGNAGYLAFYLGGGVLAGIGYLLLSGNAPVLGASGAIAAVCGAYLVLLPRTHITLIVWFWIIYPWVVPSLYAIAFQFVFEIFMTVQGWSGPASGGVAYAAHASGYIFGILVAMFLLRIRVLPRDDFDMLHLWEQHRRRRAYQRMVASGYDPFRGATTPGVRVKTVRTVSAPPRSAEETQLRQQISRACTAHNMAEAARLYEELCKVADQPTLPRQQQLDISNQFMAMEYYPQAAQAYERFIAQYDDYEYIGDIYLMLGLVYGRYLRMYPQAKENLTKAVEKLDDPGKKVMAQKDLAEVMNKLS